MISGIYKIINLVNGKFYVGSSEKIENRWSKHSRKLNAGIHENIHLQRSWDKHGEKKFIFKLIEECEINVLLEREQFYLDSLNPHYNIAKIAGSRKGVKTSEKTKKILSKINSGKNNPHWGTKRPDKTKKLISKANKGTGNGMYGTGKNVIQCDLEGNSIREWISATTAGRTLGFNRRHIYHCCNNRRKTHMGYTWKFKK